MEHNPRDDQGRYSEADLHDPWADIQRRGSILAWIVILSVYGADTIAEVELFDLSLSSLISWFMKSSIGFLNNSNLHAIISTSLTINLQWVNKIFLAVLEEIYNNVVPHWSAFLISCNHLITRLISFTKNASNLRSILYLDHGFGLIFTRKPAIYRACTSGNPEVEEFVSFGPSWQKPCDLSPKANYSLWVSNCRVYSVHPPDQRVKILSGF